MRCNYIVESRTEKGSSLIEFLIVFVFFLLPLAAFIIYFGRTIWQIQYLTDASREAARQTAYYSDLNPTAPCVGNSADGNDYIDIAYSEATNLLFRTEGGWGLSEIWWVEVPPITSAEVKYFHAGNLSNPAAKIVPISVGYTVDTYSNKCFLCFMNYLFSAYYTVNGVSDLSFKVSNCPA